MLLGVKIIVDDDDDDIPLAPRRPSIYLLFVFFIRTYIT